MYWGWGARRVPTAPSLSQRATSPPRGGTGRGVPAPSTPAGTASASPSSRYGHGTGTPPFVPCAVVGAPWGPPHCPAGGAQRRRAPQVCNGLPDCGDGDAASGWVPSDERDCGRWGPWAPWGACSRSCGPGQQLRARGCSQQGPDVLHQCHGEATQARPCFSTACPGEWARGCAWGGGAGGSLWLGCLGDLGVPVAGDAQGVWGFPCPWLLGTPGGFPVLGLHRGSGGVPRPALLGRGLPMAAAAQGTWGSP